jgi:hypothetical protein
MTYTRLHDILGRTSLGLCVALVTSVSQGTPPRCEGIMFDWKGLSEKQREALHQKFCRPSPTEAGTNAVSPERLEWRRDRAESRPHFQPYFAKPIGRRAGARPINAAHLYLGDGWGCAEVHDQSLYCWETPKQVPQTGTSIQAVHVPWLDGQPWIGAGPDRICTSDGAGSRCWRAPQFLNLPRTWQRSDPSTLAADLSWYFDKYGTHVEIDRTPVKHGAWHGCSQHWCWGAAEPPTSIKLCQAGALVMPCSIVPQVTLAEFEKWPSSGSPIVGDLFACNRRDGLECLGASRDGFFGTAEECPPELFTAWPTAAGPVAAPHAKCSRKRVRIGGTSVFFGNDASASPRGLCLDDPDELRRDPFKCFGLFDNPDPSMQVVVGLGDEPSACGITDAGKVVCWGAGYTREHEPPIAIEFDVPKSRRAVAWDGKGPYHRDCAINRNCTKTVSPLPTCVQSQVRVSLTTLLDNPEQLEGKRVTVTGRLGLSSIVSNQVYVWCGPFEKDGVTPDIKRGGGYADFCCLEAHAPIVVTSGHDYLPLEHLNCTGDTSRVCCNLPVLGQNVEVTATLAWRDYVLDLGPSWVLAQPEICEVR